MAGSAFKRLAVQTSHYSLASFLTMLAGLVTFPLLTRLFSVDDYGVMNLVAATVTVFVALGKVGVQHSIIRYHSEATAGLGRYSLAQLRSTTLLAMLGTGVVAALVLAVGSQLVPARWLGDPRIPGLTVIVSVVVAVQVFESTLIQFIRAEQRTSMLLIYQVAKKYVGVGLILFAVLVIARTLTAFYTATAIAESLTIGALALFMFRRSGFPLPSPAQFSRPLYFELLGFGIPMLIGYELSGIILSVGARYVIAGTIGEAPLGLYGAAYNLCQYVQAVLIWPVSRSTYRCGTRKAAPRPAPSSAVRCAPTRWWVRPSSPGWPRWAPSFCPRWPLTSTPAPRPFSPGSSPVWSWTGPPACWGQACSSIAKPGSSEASSSAAQS